MGPQSNDPWWTSSGSSTTPWNSWEPGWDCWGKKEMDDQEQEKVIKKKKETEDQEQEKMIKKKKEMEDQEQERMIKKKAMEELMKFAEDLEERQAKRKKEAEESEGFEKMFEKLDEVDERNRGRAEGQRALLERRLQERAQERASNMASAVTGVGSGMTTGFGDGRGAGFTGIGDVVHADGQGVAAGALLRICEKLIEKAQAHFLPSLLFHPFPFGMIVQTDATSCLFQSRFDEKIPATAPKSETNLTSPVEILDQIEEEILEIPRAEGPEEVIRTDLDGNEFRFPGTEPEQVKFEKFLRVPGGILFVGVLGEYWSPERMNLQWFSEFFASQSFADESSEGDQPTDGDQSVEDFGADQADHRPESCDNESQIASIPEDRPLWEQLILKGDFEDEYLDSGSEKSHEDNFVSSGDPEPKIPNNTEVPEKEVPDQNLETADPGQIPGGGILATTKSSLMDTRPMRRISGMVKKFGQRKITEKNSGRP
jgi:hypothetical protein